MSAAILNSISRLSAGTESAAHEVFRAACAVTDPQWTQCGSDPAGWRAPPDAAGGLVLWDHEGLLIRCEPAPSDECEAASSAYDGLLRAGCVIGTVRAPYASSGGRMVALCESGRHWYITVGRMLDLHGAYLGATESAIQQADPDATVMTLAVHATRQVVPA